MAKPTADAGPRSYSGATPRLSVDDNSVTRPKLPQIATGRQAVDGSLDTKRSRPKASAIVRSYY